MNKLKKIFVTAVAALAVGAGAGVVQEAVTPQPADATIIATYVASTSNHTVRVCDMFGGHGICKNIKPGHWSPILVDSIQVDRGCELWMHGERKAQRKNHDWWYNVYSIKSKATIRLSNCR